VVHDAVTSALARGAELLIVDTAGRLHTKTNLVEGAREARPHRPCQDRGWGVHQAPGDRRDNGQNAHRQAEVFHEAVGVDGVVLSKYDSTAKAGYGPHLPAT